MASRKMLITDDDGKARIDIIEDRSGVDKVLHTTRVAQSEVARIVSRLQPHWRVPKGGVEDERAKGGGVGR